MIIECILMIGLAYLTGRLFQKTKLPAILGWLIAGILFGFNGFGLVSESFMTDPIIKYLLVILETFAGSMIGAELVWGKIKKSGKSIVIVTLFQSLMTFVIVTAAFSVVFSFTGVPIYVAFVLGGIALATAPAPSISIVSEYKTKGPVTSTLIPMAALDDVVGIIVFFTVNAVVGSKLSGASVSLLPILVMILGPVLIGGLVGLITSLFAKKIQDKKVLLGVFLLGLFLAANLTRVVNAQLGATMSLSFFMVGLSFCAVFANIINEQLFEDMYELSSPIIMFSLMILIFSMGVPLDIHMIKGAGLLTLVYIGSRMVGKISGAYVGSSVMKMPDTVKKYLGLTLLPHSGVSLFFTSIAATTIMPFDPASAVVIQSTIAAAAVINEVIAVLLAKKGFEKAGELNKA